MRETALKDFQQLEELYPEAATQLKHENPLQLLIAVILSAQCTDKRVNMVTEKLFKNIEALLIIKRKSLNWKMI